MTEDLVKRLRCLGDHASFEPHMHHTAADRIEKLEEEIGILFAANVRLNSRADLDSDGYVDRIKKLEAALKNIADGDIPRTVKIPFRDDKQPSKNDRCEHGQWFYEDCGCCIEDYARNILGKIDE